MDKETRRERLRIALAGRQIKEEDRSYISQLLSGTASFGEKAARRLERDYLLPAMSLDEPFEQINVDPVTKDLLIERVSRRLAEMSTEKLRALALLIDA